MPAAPRWLSKEAKKEWHRLAQQLFDMRLLTQIDQTALAAFSDCLVQYIAETEFLNQNRGSIVRRDKAQRRAMRLLDQLRSLGEGFGWTPLSRSRLSVPTEKQESLDVIAKRRADAFRAAEVKKNPA
jgi:P27 family predicted phage terminase small subunit